MAAIRCTNGSEGGPSKKLRFDTGIIFMMITFTLCPFVQKCKNTVRNFHSTNLLHRVKEIGNSE